MNLARKNTKNIITKQTKNKYKSTLFPHLAPWLNIFAISKLPNINEEIEFKTRM
jgi:hypothetical protein